MADRVGVLFICLGNICRSPLGEGLMRDKVRAAGLADRIFVDSCGTSSYHAGEPPNPNSVRVAAQHGIDISDQRSRQLVRSDLSRFAWLIAMDASNQSNTERLGDCTVHRLRDFDPSGPGDVPDPWGGSGDGYREVYEIVDRSCEMLLERIEQDLAGV
ncbi:MAG: low molecular weight phosphotyrosine protein phosphatase [Proteobacteria bacterium]|nr:low molecular weight phosphotyrosine protein phosphatase [Pseudomonadota bacterium]MCP4920738.1 low molecular weight phosphotyrosine protein phosphatase [Pseudomonadota bacterium]